MEPSLKILFAVAPWVFMDKKLMPLKISTDSKTVLSYIWELGEINPGFSLADYCLFEDS